MRKNRRKKLKARQLGRAGGDILSPSPELYIPGVGTEPISQALLDFLGLLFKGGWVRNDSLLRPTLFRRRTGLTWDPEAFQVAPGVLNLRAIAQALIDRHAPDDQDKLKTAILRHGSTADPGFFRVLSTVKAPRNTLRIGPPPPRRRRRRRRQDPAAQTLPDYAIRVYIQRPVHYHFEATEVWALDIQIPAATMQRAANANSPDAAIAFVRAAIALGVPKQPGPEIRSPTFRSFTRGGLEVGVLWNTRNLADTMTQLRGTRNHVAGLHVPQIRELTEVTRDLRNGMNAYL